MIDEKAIFERSALFLGDDVLEALRSCRVIIFGVGGVGSWCAEGLIRTGVVDLTIVDMDKVCASNINRQLEATSQTVGRVKVDALRERLLEINPYAKITALEKAFSEETWEEFRLDDYDYIVDAIDSLKDKISLIVHGSAARGKMFSSMGAALKVDPTKIRVAEFWDVRGCPLGAMLRKRIRQKKLRLSAPVTCVYDEEVLENRGAADCGKGSGGIGGADCSKGAGGVGGADCGKGAGGIGGADCGKGAGGIGGADCSKGSGGGSCQSRVNGSLVGITAIFGMTLCSLIVKDVYTASRPSW